MVKAGRRDQACVGARVTRPTTAACRLKLINAAVAALPRANSSSPGRPARGGAEAGSSASPRAATISGPIEPRLGLRVAIAKRCNETVCRASSLHRRFAREFKALDKPRGRQPGRGGDTESRLPDSSAHPTLSP